MLSKIIEDSKYIPKKFKYKLNNKLLTLSDEEKACTKPSWAYVFARDVAGADIGKCCEAACKNPWWAHNFALNIPGANIEKCQEATCKDPGMAYYFTYYIPGKTM